MNSADINFSGWQKWGAETGVPDCFVYAFRTPLVFGRVKGESDLVYIGSGTGRRLESHLSKRPKSDRLNRIAQEYGGLEVSWKQFATKADAIELESKLLDKYQHEHLELPPVNRNVPKKDTYERAARK